METTVAKWGNSYAVRIPRLAMEKARFKEGDKLDLELFEDGLLLRPQRRLSLMELVAGITPANRPSADDWNSSVEGV